MQKTLEIKKNIKKKKYANLICYNKKKDVFL